MSRHIVGSQELKLKRGHFQFQVTAQELVVAQELYTALEKLEEKRYRVLKIKLFLNMLWAAPKLLADVLDWKEDEVKQARDEMVELLRKEISREELSDVFLMPVPTKHHSHPAREAT